MEIKVRLVQRQMPLERTEEQMTKEQVINRILNLTDEQVKMLVQLLAQQEQSFVRVSQSELKPSA